MGFNKSTYVALKSTYEDFKSTCLDLKTTCVDEGFALQGRDFSLCSSGVILVLLSWISSGGAGFSP